MTKEQIIGLPNKSLRMPSKRVGIINAEVLKLVSDMQSATLDWEDSREHEAGVALAAVQIDQLFKVIVVRNNFEEKKDRSFSVFINPKIVKKYGQIVEDFEGCLSVPNIYGKVPRNDKVKVEALNETGQKVRVNAEGFLARVFQHEIDHIEGKVFVDIIKQRPECFYKLDEKGGLEPLDYETDVKQNSILW